MKQFLTSRRQKLLRKYSKRIGEDHLKVEKLRLLLRGEIYTKIRKGEYDKKQDKKYNKLEAWK